MGVDPITGVSPPLGWAGRGLHHRGESSAGQKEDGGADQVSVFLLSSSLSFGTNYFCGAFCCKVERLNHQVSFVPLKRFDQVVPRSPPASSVLTPGTTRDPGKRREVRREKAKALLRHAGII